MQLGYMSNTMKMPAPAVIPTAHLVTEPGAVIDFKPGATSWIIGREDPITGSYPDIDLTPYDTEASVSRRHAEIYLNGQQFNLVSLNPTNWTKLNNRLLTPNVPIVIRSGDRLEIAGVHLVFRI